MKKRITFVVCWAVTLGFLLWSGLAYANGSDNDDQENGDTEINVTVKPKIKTNILNYNKVDNDVEIDNNVKAYGGDGGSVNIGNGMFNKVLSPEAKATIEKGAVDIDNTNTNLNTNFNTNKNELEQDQDQKQGQLQGQLQGQSQDASNTQEQGQSQDASNKQGQSQKMGDQKNKQNTEVDITFISPVNKREHIRALDITKQENLTSDRDAGKAKVNYSILDKMSFFKDFHADKLAKDCDDYEIDEALLFDNPAGDGIQNFSYNNEDPTGAYMGQLILTSNGDDVNANGCIGRILQKAMYRGANQIKFIHLGAVDSAVSDSKSIGFTTSASVAGTRDDYMVAPGGGTGKSWADAWHEMRPEIVAELYYDSKYVK
jgi:hypothetical protein